MKNYVYLLFSDQTWFFARRDQIDEFCKVHKWKDEDVPKSVIVLPAAPAVTIEPSTTINLEDE